MPGVVYCTKVKHELIQSLNRLLYEGISFREGVIEGWNTSIIES